MALCMSSACFAGLVASAGPSVVCAEFHHSETGGLPRRLGSPCTLERRSAAEGGEGDFGMGNWVVPRIQGFRGVSAWRSRLAGNRLSKPDCGPWQTLHLQL